MWIMSQCQRILIECDNLNNINIVGLLDGKFTIKYNSITLGIYSTEEKALNVLDRIRNFINRISLNIYDSKFGIFQMPQDSEV